MNNKIDNKIRPIGEPIIYLIQGNNYVKIEHLKRRNSEFYDVTFYNNNKKIFLGRFNNDYDNFRVAYNKGKILIYSDNYDENIYTIKSVIALYDILDETFYSSTPEESLEVFAPNLSKYYSNENNKPIYRSDTEKRKRLELSK
ncbi:MAG: hypothetical protein IJY25_06380 [Bacilli bacterium]|nr:hypothetical protein [Bacilli bacterium]